MSTDALHITEAFIGFAVIAAILVALADTRFYGLAIAMVGISLLSIVLSHPATVTAVSGLIAKSAKATGG